VNFGVLALIVLAGLAGPLLGAGRSIFVPLVIGEILAGVVIGRTGLDAVDTTDPTVLFLSDVGFAMLMFTVGAHVPLRDRRLRAFLRGGAVAAGAVLLLTRPVVLPRRRLPARATPACTPSCSPLARSLRS
jgi:Kef-type K+ transport system membrane component KefB